MSDISDKDLDAMERLGKSYGKDHKWGEMLLRTVSEIRRKRQWDSEERSHVRAEEISE